MREHPPTDLATIFLQHMQQTSQDRRSQTAEFRASIDQLRSDVRILGVLALLGILALAGIQVSTPTVKLSPAVAVVEKP